MPVTATVRATRPAKPAARRSAPRAAARSKKNPTSTAGAHARKPSRAPGALAVEALLRSLGTATTLERIETERRGVDGRVLKEIARRMDVPAMRVFEMLGIPRATAEKKAATGEVLAGAGGQATLGLLRLMAQAEALVVQTRTRGAPAFDADRWLGTWLERPQPALGGRRPSDLLDTPTGVSLVERLLGALESGAYL